MVAAGSGVRLGEPIPKALVSLAGTSLVRRSVDALALAGVERVLVTIPPGEEAAFADALEGAPIPVLCVAGGERRQDSVRLGLAALPSLPGTAGVLVHDAARPLITSSVVSRVIEALRGGALAVVPTVAVVDSIRQTIGESSVVVERARLRAVQTPQGFSLAALKRAHDFVEEQGIDVTDDAAACETAGMSVVLVEGERRSLKITEPMDLLLAEAILAAEGRS